MENSEVEIERNLAYIKNQFQPDPKFVSQLREKLEHFPLLKYRQDKTKRLLLFIAVGLFAILTYVIGRNSLEEPKEK